MSNSRTFNPIHRRRGWGIFLFGLGIALIFGLSIRSIFSSSALENWAKQKIEGEGLQRRLKVTGVHLDLSSSSFPRVNFKIDKLVYQGKGLCPPYVLTLNDVYLPVRFFSALQKQFALNTVYVADGELAVQPPCQVRSLIEPKPGSELKEALEKEDGAKKGDRSVAASHKKAKSQLEGQLESRLKELLEYFQKRWSSDWRRGRLAVEGLEVDRLVIFDAASHKRWAVVSKMAIELNKSESFSLDAKIKLEDYLFRGNVVRPFSLNMEGDSQQAKIELDGFFQEGRVSAIWDVNWEDETQALGVKAKDFPLRGLGTIYKEWLGRDLPLNLRRVWLTCQLQHQSKLSNLRASELQVSDCDVYGNGGKLKMKKLQVSLSEEVQVEPFSIVFDDVSLEHFVSVIGSRGPMGILNSLGRVHGSLNFKSVEEVSGHFDVKGLDLAFSNNGVHGHQRVAQVRVNLEYAKKRYSGLISRIDLEEGEFSGTISFNLDSNLKEGVVQVKIKELLFNPSIQRLLVGGELSSLALYGKAKINNGEFEQWSGTFGAQSVRGLYWELDEFKMDMEWVKRTMYGDVRVKSLLFKEGSRIQPIMQSLLLRKQPHAGQSRWQGLQAELKMDSVRGSWKKLQVENTKHKGVTLSSYGEWLRDGDLDGVIVINSPTMPNIDWRVIGGWNSLSIYPTQKSVRKIVAASKKSRRSREILSESWFEEMVKKSKLIQKKVRAPQESRITK